MQNYGFPCVCPDSVLSVRAARSRSTKQTFASFLSRAHHGVNVDIVLEANRDATKFAVVTWQQTSAMIHESNKAASVGNPDRIKALGSHTVFTVFNYNPSAA